MGFYCGVAMNLKKALQLSLLLGKIYFAESDADSLVYEEVSPELYKQLDVMDQPAGYFKSTNKWPYYWVVDPSTNSLKQILCGSYDQEAAANIEIKKPEQLAAISPLRFSVMNIDQGTCEDVRYQGYRDTMLGQLVEQLLKKIKVIPDRHFKGRLFIDEYEQGIPQKWVFATAQEFGYLRKYIQANFELHSINPLDVKPILALHILKNPTQLTAHDLSFLKTYFTVVDPTDKKVSSFFKKHEKSALKAISLLRKGFPIKQTFLEKEFHKIEERCKKFSMESYIVMAVTAALTYVYKDQIITWLTKKTEKQTKKFKEFHDKNEWKILDHKTEIIVGGALSTLGIALLINYWYQSKHEKPEQLPAVTYGNDFDDDFCNDGDDENSEVNEVEEQLAAEFIANR